MDERKFAVSNTSILSTPADSKSNLAGIVSLDTRIIRAGEEVGNGFARRLLS